MAHDVAVPAHSIGVDLGGTKIELVVMTDDVIHRERVATPKTAAGIVATIAGLVERAEATVGATCPVGIGTPGSLTGAGVLQNSNTVCLNGYPLHRELCARLERDVAMANDADCFALSEARDGAALGARSVFGVILGTGTGGGIVVGGELLTGPNGLTGEWGHNRLPDAGSTAPACYCGRRGCVETYLSGPGMAADHLAHTGERRTAAEIAMAAPKEPAAAATIERYAERLGRALAVVVNVLDPEVIVLGGGLSNIAALYALVPPHLDRHAFCSVPLATRLLPALHGDASGVRGAAWLARRGPD